jgi:peptide/nickel transport system ATP-binding protein
LFITHDLSLGYYISERAVILYRGCVVEIGSTDKVYDKPLHPYTRMLMSAVPRLDKKWEEVEIELKAKQAELTGGCVYYHRCPDADEACATERPALIEVQSDHFVACGRHTEVA